MNLGLGTVQFGLDYGIANSSGQVAVQEVLRILNYARVSGVRVLDTAPAYGESEEVLGRLDADRQFDLVTKTLAVKTTKITQEQSEKVYDQFLASLRRLRTESVYGLIVHHADDLLVPGGERIYHQLQKLKSKGLVQKIGASIYSQEQIEQLFERYQLDLVQVPVNVLDQRLVVGGCLNQLKSLGVEIHSRSAFLQGLLLAEPNTLREFFNPIKDLLLRYREHLASRGISPIAAALQYINTVKEIDCCIVGVDSLVQFKQIVEGFQRESPQTIDYESFSSDIENILNPSSWKT